jgi:hypothetical protein
MSSLCGRPSGDVLWRLDGAEAAGLQARGVDSALAVTADPLEQTQLACQEMYEVAHTVARNTACGLGATALASGQTVRFECNAVPCYLASAPRAVAMRSARLLGRVLDGQVLPSPET